MRPLRKLRLSAAAAGGLALVALCAGMGTAASAKPSKSHATFPQKTCFWTNEIDSNFDTNPAHNYAFPDSGAVYWSAKVTMPAGSTIVFKGQYAHARYQSLNSYNDATNAPIDAVNDVSTRPAHGSTNPFRPGANRDATKRSYTITMVNQPPPVAPATGSANTLYAGVSGQTVQELLYRIYLPDSFKRGGLTGGVALPNPELRLASGQVLKGQAACNDLDPQRGQLSLTTLSRSAYDSLRDKPSAPLTFPAAPTPAFRTYYNTSFIISCWYGGNCSGNPARTGGQYSNIDNQYVAAFVNRGSKAGPVLVLHGKLPTTPKTGPNVTRMGSGQMRYWSMCQNESLYTTKGAGCVYDSEIPVNSKGDYTIVTSLAKDRPKNATAQCGVAYLPWPKNGDGAGHLTDGLLLVRNMLPSPSFHHAIQDTTTPGDEKAVLGQYYPVGKYTTKAAFQKHGC